MPMNGVVVRHAPGFRSVIGGFCIGIFIASSYVDVLVASDEGVPRGEGEAITSYAVPASAALQEISFDWPSRTLLARNGGLGTRPICLLTTLTDPIDDARPLYTMPTCTHAYFGRTADEFVAFDRALRQWQIFSRTKPATGVEGLELPDGAVVNPLQVRRTASGNAVVGYAAVRFKGDQKDNFRIFMIDLATGRGKWGPNGEQPTFIGGDKEICFVEYYGRARSRIMRSGIEFGNVSEVRECAPAVVGISVSADGITIAGVELRPKEGRRVVIYNLETKKATYLAQELAESYLPLFALRDARLLAFRGYERLEKDDDAHHNEMEIRGELYIRYASGKIDRLAKSVGEYCWDREGRALLWVSSDPWTGMNVKLNVAEFEKP